MEHLHGDIISPLSLLALYNSYIHSCLNYANLAWGCNYQTNLKKLRSQQKHAIRIVHNKTKFEHTKELFKSTNVLNLYKLNILSIAIFMHEFIQKYLLHYTTRSSTLNFSKSKLKLS